MRKNQTIPNLIKKHLQRLSKYHQETDKRTT